MTNTVMVAVPAIEWMYTAAIASLLDLRLPPGSQIRFTFGPRSIAAKRQDLAEQFEKRSEFSHLLFLDSDQTPHPGTVERLLSHHLPFVGAAIFGRAPPLSAKPLLGVGA